MTHPLNARPDRLAITLEDAGIILGNLKRMQDYLRAYPAYEREDLVAELRNDCCADGARVSKVFYQSLFAYGAGLKTGAPMPEVLHLIQIKLKSALELAVQRGYSFLVMDNYCDICQNFNEKE